MSINEQIIDILKTKSNLTASQIIAASAKPRSSVFKALTEMVKSGQLVKGGSHPQITYAVTHPSIQQPLEPLNNHSDSTNELSKLSKTVQDSNRNPVYIILISLIAILLALLSYNVYQYVASTQELNRLHLQITQQAQALDQVQSKLLDNQQELNRRDIELNQLIQEKNELSLKQDQQQKELLAQKQLITELKEKVKLILVQLDNERKLSAKIVKENAQLKEQIKTVQEVVQQQNKLLEAHAFDLNLLKQGLHLSADPLTSAVISKSELGGNSPLIAPVSIDQILTWTKQGMSSIEIIERIKDSHSIYSLLPETVQMLKDAKVSADVIKFLQG